MSRLTNLEYQSRAEDAAVRRACIQRVRAYVDRTRMNLPDFARAAGMGQSTLKVFLADQYHLKGGNAIKVVQLCNSYMDAYPIAVEQGMAGQLFETANVRLIRETFSKLLARPRAFLIYAPPGSQKTFVLEHEIQALNLRRATDPKDHTRAFYIYCRQNIAPLDLMRRVATACGCPSKGGVDRILEGIRREHTGRRVMLVFDEAQHLDMRCFEHLRELLDRSPFASLLFAGSHDLYLKFERASATLEQWNSRIAQKVRLPGCTREEAAGIVAREVGHILNAPRRPGAPSAADLTEKLITKATVVDAYLPVTPGRPAATYINIRTLTNALDDLRTQYEEAQAQKEAAA